MAEHPTKIRLEPTPPVKYSSELNNATSVSISNEAQKASKNIIVAAEHGDVDATSMNVDLLVTEIAQDFRDHDAPIPKNVEHTLRETMQNGIDKNRSRMVTDKIFSPEIRKELEEYRNTIKAIEETYKLPSQAPEFFKAAKTLQINRVLLNLGLYGISNSANVLRFERIAGELKKINAAVGYKKLIHAMIAGREMLPMVYALGLIPPIMRQASADKNFEQSVIKLRSYINERIAHSVFMRDFEFIHDKPASEIMNIVNKGKQATVDLMRTSYKDLFPDIASVGSIMGTETLIAPPAGILALLRVPLLAKNSEKMARSILSERAESLSRKDVVDARVLSSLQSLEVVRTTDSIVNAMGELKDNMSKIDDIEQEGHKLRGQRDNRHQWIGAAYTYSIPAVAAGWETLMQFAEHKLSPSHDSSTSAIGSVTLAAGSSLALEQTNSALVENIVHTYVDKIQPALQDIKRMEDLLGPYDQVDVPDGPRESARIPVEDIANFDISINNLQFKNILHNVSMDIPQGSFVTIKGPSGIGKTTFLRHLLGLFNARDGSIRYGGIDLSEIKKFGEHSVYAKLAYANQNPQYFENMTLRDNLLLWTKNQVSDEMLLEILHDLNLDHIADRMDSKVKHFSGGELRRIGLARALLKNPKVLFLDEPTSNLDQESARQVLEIVKEMRRKRPEMTVVAVTHDPNFEEIAEKIVDFSTINKPSEQNRANLGDRQVFYASSK